MLPRSYYTEDDPRKRQIITLKAFMFDERITQLIEDSEYRVDFKVKGKNMSVTILLPPEYPNEPPRIFVSPAVSHPWIDENTNQVLRSPDLLNYSTETELGRIVINIIEELQLLKHVPRIATFEDVQRRHQILEESQQGTAGSMMHPKLNELTSHELMHILHSTDLQDKVLESNPQLIELENETEELLASIDQIAQDNLVKQKTLDDMKTDMIERISSTVQMKMNYEELNRKHQKLSEMYDPHNIRDLLKEATLKADDEAEHVAQQFLLGKMPADTFVTKYAEKRALGQARRAREERLAHQLTQLDKANT